MNLSRPAARRARCARAGADAEVGRHEVFPPADPLILPLGPEILQAPPTPGELVLRTYPKTPAWRQEMIAHANSSRAT